MNEREHILKYLHWYDDVIVPTSDEVSKLIAKQYIDDLRFRLALVDIPAPVVKRLHLAIHQQNGSDMPENWLFDGEI